MAALIRPELFLLIGGTSLSEGRLCTPDQQWPRLLVRDMIASPECKGRVTMVNAGAGSQQSSYLQLQCERLGGMGFTHALLEGCTINDVAPLSDAFGNPPAVVDVATQTANLTAAVAALRAGNPDIVICGQTMSPASASDTNRLDLLSRYEQELLIWEGLDCETLANHEEWTWPLDPTITANTDGLHPLFYPADAFRDNSYPAILAKARAWMGAWWP